MSLAVLIQHHSVTDRQDRRTELIKYFVYINADAQQISSSL